MKMKIKYTPDEYWKIMGEYYTRFLEIACSLKTEELFDLMRKHGLINNGVKEVKPMTLNFNKLMSEFPSPVASGKSFEQYELNARKWFDQYLKTVKEEYFSKCDFNLSDYHRESDGRIRYDFEAWDKYIKAFEMRRNGSTYQDIGTALRQSKKSNKDELNSLISAGKSYVERAEVLIAKAGLFDFQSM